MLHGRHSHEKAAPLTLSSHFWGAKNLCLPVHAETAAILADVAAAANCLFYE